MLFRSVGRIKTYEAIVKGENIPEPGVPAGFKVLIKELQSLGLDVRLYSQEGKELELKENIEEGIDFNLERDDKEKLKEIEAELTDGFEEETLDEDAEASEDDMYDDDLLDEEIDAKLAEEAVMLEDSEELFDSDLADDNIDNDEDLI